METSPENNPEDSLDNAEEEMKDLLDSKEDNSPAQKKPYHYDPILPPCRICGTKATGYHFGVITCEACKIFFRRSLGRQKPYRCKGTGNCAVVPDRRLSCSFCRLQKCHRLGMSRDGIQRGRYTVEKKSRCILEVKQLQSLSPGTPMPSDSPESSESSSNMEAKYYVSGTDGQTNNNIPGCSDNNDTSSSSNIKLEAESNEISGSSSQADGTAMGSPKSSANSSASATISKLLQTATLEELVRIISAADQKTLMVESEQMAKLKMMRDTVGPPHVAEELRDPTEVDNRKHKFAKCIIGLVTDIKQFIKFAKLLPGFLELCLEDQILLLREGMLDWVMFSTYEAMDCKSNVSICASCQNVYTMKDFQDIGDPGYYQQSLLAAKVLHRLQLYPEELAVFKALSIYSPDGSEGSLKEPEKVEDLQARMVEVLRYVIAKKRSITENADAAIMLGRFVHTLTETRAHSLRCKQLVDQCLIQLFPDIEYPELLLEMFGDERVNMLQSLRAANNSSSDNDMSSITDPMSPHPSAAAPCDCDPINKDNFKDRPDITDLRREQLDLYEQNNSTVNIRKIANDAVVAQSISSQINFPSSQPNSSSVRPHLKRASMLQTALLEDSSCWEELWAQTPIAMLDRRITSDRENTPASHSKTLCSTTCDSKRHEDQHVCVSPDVVKYLFSRGMRPQDMEKDFSQNIEEEITSGDDKVRGKKKHHDCFPILPPCKVCGAKATGFHFGAITCDACQIFFRRSLERQKPYKCKGNGDCNVVPDRRLTCSYCRLQRCHQLGMSRDAIQRGRYTVERKTYCIQEARLASEAVTDEKDESTDNDGDISDSQTPIAGRRSAPQDNFVNGEVKCAPASAGMSPAPATSHTGRSQVYELGISPSNRVRSLEGNQLTNNSALSFHGPDFLPNDANNNLAFDSCSNGSLETGQGHKKQSSSSSSTDLVSDAFRVMNDMGSHESDFLHGSSGYQRAQHHQHISLNPSSIHLGGSGNFSEDPYYSQNHSQKPDEARAPPPHHGSGTPPETTTAQYPSSYSPTKSSPMSNSYIFGDSLGSSNVSGTNSPVTNSTNIQFMECSYNAGTLTLLNETSNHHVSNSQTSKTFSAPCTTVYSTVSTSAFTHANHPDPVPSTSSWDSMEAMDSECNVLDCSSVNHHSSTADISGNSSYDSAPGFLDLSQPFYSEEPLTRESIGLPYKAMSENSRDSVIKKVPPSLGEKYDPEVEKLIEIVTNAHLATLMVTDENREALFKSQTRHIEYRKLRESVFGRMDPLCPEQYKELYKRTGLDVDNRRTKISQCFLTQVTYVNKLAQFAQKIPGFSDLILDDQITLLRGSAGEFMLFVNLETFDCEHKIYTCSVCQANYDKEEFLAMGDMEFHDQWVTAAQVIQKLELRDPEAALLKALSLFSPDGLVGLPHNKHLIQTMQMRIAEALCYTIRRERDLYENSEVAILFGRLVNALTELKHASLLGKRLIDRFIIEMFPDIEYPEVLMEIYGDETRKKLFDLRASRQGDATKGRKSPA